jgi:MarR family transcriptional regulator, lower aerobic nicotinate degradation pathway regulator
VSVTTAETISDTLLPASLRRRETFALIKLAALVRQECAEKLAGTGLSQHQHAILCCLEEFGATFQKDIAVRLGIDSGDIVAFIDGLQARALVVRRRDERDRRRQILTITPDGSRALAEAEELYGQAESELLGVLSPSQREALHEAALLVLSAHAPESWLAEDE